MSTGVPTTQPQTQPHANNAAQFNDAHPPALSNDGTSTHLGGQGTHSQTHTNDLAQSNAARQPAVSNDGASTTTTHLGGGQETHSQTQHQANDTTLSQASHPQAVSNDGTSTTAPHPAGHGLHEPVRNSTHSSLANDATSTTATPGSDTPSKATEPEGGYPEQMHSGKVGLGPNYHQGPTFDDKLTGFKEEIKGKITRNPELAQKGKDRKTGELKRREKEQDENPFHAGEEEEEDEGTNKNDIGSKPTATGDEMHHEKVRAATVAPEGTDAGAKQGRGEAGDGIKHIG